MNNSALPNSRWYSGSGTYRPVWLMVGDNIHMKPWGIFASTPEASFELNYEAGELQAVAYKDGKEVSSTLLHTSLEPAAIQLTPDRKTLKAEFGDLSYITVELLDAQGNLICNADHNVYYTACGVGRLLAVGNSNPMSEEMYVGNQRRVHEEKKDSG